MRRDRTAEYERGNAEAARIVLEHPEVYGPGLVRWAEMWVSRHGGQQHAAVASVGSTVQRSTQMVLFEQGAA